LVDFRFDQGWCLFDACIPDTVSHWFVFPAKLSDWLIFALMFDSRRHSGHGQPLAVFHAKVSDWLIFASIPDTVSHWLVFLAKLSDWLIFASIRLGV
jgi:hypothetical protein